MCGCCNVWLCVGVGIVICECVYVVLVFECLCVGGGL